MNPKISIIIPVYNAEEHLEKCLHSIADQTYSNLEVLLINDGSSDKSGVICDSFQSSDSRFFAIHKKNEGTSSARNLGLAKATGDYIGFIDSDDHIKLNMYEKMVGLVINYNLDLVTCEHENSIGQIIKLNVKEHKEIISIDDYLVGIQSIPNGIFNVWSKLFSARLAKSTSFIHGKIHQDALYVSEILQQVNQIGIVNTPLYIYNIENESVTRSKYDTKRVDGIEVVLKAQKNLAAVASSKGAIEGVRKWFIEFLLGHYGQLSVRTGFDKDGKIRKKLINLLKKYRQIKPIDLRVELAINLPSKFYGFLFYGNLQKVKIKRIISKISN